MFDDSAPSSSAGPRSANAVVVTMDPLALAADLIAIDSRNPTLIDGAPGESAIITFCAEWFSHHGFVTSTVGRDETRPSLIARFDAGPGGRILLLNGHVDTVDFAAIPSPAEPADHADRPRRAPAPAARATPTIVDDRLYGRGAYDMKAAVAAVMVASVRASRSLRRGSIVVTLVADEEFASIGTEDVLAAMRSSLPGHPIADGAVVAEPSGGELITAHRGFAWFEVEVFGRRAHGSMPHEGADAIAQAGVVLEALRDYEKVLLGRAAHPRLGHGTVRVSTIAGGTDAATVADRCVLTVERRFGPELSPLDVETELRHVVDAVAEQIPGTSTGLRPVIGRSAFEADEESSIVRAIRSAASDTISTPIGTRAEPFWTDAALIADAGVPTVLLGVDGGGPHADVEWASIRSLTTLTDILHLATVRFCSDAASSVDD